MGLERLACVMQDVDNLFEVDTVMNVLHHVEHIAGSHYGRDEKDDISIRVITDHIRAATFMVSDGILPSNEGRGYVLRRLLRRAARHGRMLGINRPFLMSWWTPSSIQRGRLPRAARARDLYQEGHRHRGGELRPHHRRRHEHPDDMMAEHLEKAREDLLRRRRLQAERYLRLPHRPDHGDRRRAGHDRRRGRLPQLR